MDEVAIRRTLERRHGPGWLALPFGEGWRFDHRADRLRILVTCGRIPQRSSADLSTDFVKMVHTEETWIHASIGYPDHMPTYSDLAMLHDAVFGDRYAFQVFPPKDRHVNIHPNVLHLWGREDGVSPLPDFAWLGTI